MGVDTVEELNLSFFYKRENKNGLHLKDRDHLLFVENR